MNEAYRTLSDPVARAEYLLHVRGIDATDETDTKLPVEFLERQLERREAADEAADAHDEAALAALSKDVARRGRAIARRASSVRSTATICRRRVRLVRELRFLAKLAEDLDALQRGGARRMALFQISEPGESPLPHARKRAIGIDLGTTNSLVATVRNGLAVVLPDDEGRPLVPSIVRYGEQGDRRRLSRHSRAAGARPAATPSFPSSG